MEQSVSGNNPLEMNDTPERHLIGHTPKQQFEMDDPSNNTSLSLPEGPQLSLDDFNVATGGLSLESFTSRNPASSLLSASNAAQIAAADALMSDSIDLEAFRVQKQSLRTSTGLDMFITRERDQNRSLLKSIVDDGEFVFDDELTDEDKGRFLLTAKDGFPEVYPYTSLNLMNQAILSFSETETENEAETRTMLSEVAENVWQEKRDIQIAINAAILEDRNPSIWDENLDMAELFVPFMEWKNVRRVGKALMGDEFKPGFMGGEKEQILEYIDSVPYEKRKEMIERVIQIVKDNNDLIFSDGNDAFALDMLQKMLVDGSYSKRDKFIDNFFSVLDVTGLGYGLAKGIKAGGRGAISAKDAYDRSKEAEAAVRLRELKGNAKPNSPKAALAATNPEKNQAAARVIADDETGEAAEALAGTTREDAIVEGQLPEPVIKDGDPIPHKPTEDITRQDIAEAEVRRLTDEVGNDALTDAEIAANVSRVETTLKDTKVPRHQIQNSTITTLDNGAVKFSMMYRPDNVGWKTAEEAVENALFSFRNYGIKRENITLHRRNGKGNWVPTTEREIKAAKVIRDDFVKKKKKIPADLKDLDYSFTVDYEYRFDDNIEFTDDFKINRNWADFFSFNGGLADLGQGSITQSVFDPGSVFPKFFVESAAGAVDRGVRLRKELTTLFKDAAVTYNKLKSPRRVAVRAFIEDANLNGRAWNDSDLLHEGFNEVERNILRQWKRANDIIWRVSNQSYVSVLKGQGYKIFTNGVDTTLIAKPKGKQAFTQHKDLRRVRFYDEETGVTVKLNKNQIEDIYANGGEIGEFVTPQNFKGKQAIGVISRNNPKSYFRSMSKDEVVLNYREGYYPVMYDANWFIDVKMKDGSRKTVGSANTKSVAMKFVKNYADSHPDVEVQAPRLDKRTLLEKGGELGERGKSEWDLATSRGLTSQRVRGERLIDADVNPQFAGHSNLVDPMEAVARQINQISTKMSMNTWLTMAKQRWMKMYGDKIDLPKDKMGADGFPTSVKVIESNQKGSLKNVADARTTFNLIRSYEEGYINGVDRGVQMIMQGLGDLAAAAKVDIGEKVFRGAAKRSPSQAAKAGVFKLYLAANPFRQLVIQGHQSVQLAAYNPTYLAGPIQKDLLGLLKAERGIGNAKEVELLNEFKRSGQYDAVDANNIIRQDLLRFADSHLGQKIGTVVDKPFQKAQQFGFNAAEQLVLVSSWLAHRDKFLKGKPKDYKLTRTDYQRIAGASRAFTFNMNRAGDMPYNQNTLAVIAQFMQVPHKAMLQPFTNKNLTIAQRGQLMAFNTIMYGPLVLPAGQLITDMLLTSDADPLTKEIVSRGVESVLLNHLLTLATGEKQQISFRDLAPSDSTNLVDFVSGFLTSSPAEMAAASPAGAMVFGANPRLLEVLSVTAKATVPAWDYQDPRVQTNYKDVAIAALSMTSGFNNWFKGQYALEARKKVSSLGNVTDQDITELEANFQKFFGLGTQTEDATRRIGERLRKGTVLDNAGQIEDSVKDWYNAYKRHITRRGISIEERDMGLIALSEAWRVFGNYRPEANKQIQRMIENDYKRGDYQLFDSLRRHLKFDTFDETRAMVESLPASESKDRFNEMLDRYEEVFDGANE